MAGLLSKLFGPKVPRLESFDQVRVDMHSHLLAGIDDGSQSIKDSLEMIGPLMDLGYKKFICTPHVMSDSYRNTPETIGKALGILRKAVKDNGWNVEIEAAAEYYLDEAFLEMLGTKELLTFGGDEKYVLFETSYLEKPLFFEQAVFEMNTKGYTPVMAHPERYVYLWDENEDELDVIRSKGMKFQVNISSFLGAYNIRARRIAEILAKAELIDFLGTDIHRIAQLPNLQDSLSKSKALNALIRSGNLLNLKL